MDAFSYHRPTSLDEAVELIAQNGDAKLLAGGHTLIPTMKQSLAAPSALVDLKDITGLRGIELKGDTLHIGAMTTHAAVAASPIVLASIRALATLAGDIGDPHVRNRGTIGGSIANNDPSADYPAACLALDVTVVTTRRRISSDAFFVGMFETALDDDEIIVEVLFPVPIRAGYSKFPHPASRFPLVGVFVSKQADNVRVAVTGAGPGVFRVPQMEDALVKNFAPEALLSVGVSAEGLNSDMHADSAYRAQLVNVMARRAVAAA
jgi:carbon-monoxide dehydrogenase medium subunit